MVVRQLVFSCRPDEVAAGGDGTVTVSRALGRVLGPEWVNRKLKTQVSHILLIFWFKNHPIVDTR